MTLSNSERFRRFLQLDTTIDRTPVIEWAGWWDKTIARWQEEDLPVIDDYADGINDYWGQDLLHQYWCPLRGTGMPYATSHGGPVILDEKDYEKVRPFLFTDEVLEELRQSPKAEGQTRIYTHGEKEVEASQRILAEGIPVNENTLREMKEICADLGVDMAHFLGEFDIL